MRKIAYILLSGMLAFMLASCALLKGSVLITENITGTGCDIVFSEWNGQEKCELYFAQNDEVLVEIECKQGNIALDIRSKNGLEAYKGNGLKNAVFSVQVPEEGEYVISVKGNRVSGNIMIKKVNE